MISDARILAYTVRKWVRMFSIPHNRRDLAQTLRRVRIQNGRQAARLMLADYSNRNLQATLPGR